MVLFLYGDDSYRLKQKVKALKEKFISASLGDTNLAVLDGPTLTYDELVRQILAMPFLAKSRLVIVNNLFEAKKNVLEKMTDFLVKVPKTTVMVIAEEGVPDKRTSLFKKINKPGSAQEFKLLEPDQLRRWVKKEVENRNGKIETEAISKLVEYVGSDLWRMTSEIEKLIDYERTVTSETVEILVTPQIQSNIFDLMDSVAAKSPRQALAEVGKLLAEGKPEPYILSMIVMEYRNLLMVKDMVERTSGRPDRWQISKKIGLHPFVAQKTLGLGAKYSFEELKKIYKILLNFDTKIKTGKMEPRVALELLIFKLTKK